MLIRPRGAKEGVAEYLRDGKKAGREYSRDELDHRVELLGNLVMTDSIIKGLDKDGQNYIHFTMSFAEKDISPEILRQIVDEFKKFAFAAFSKDAYNLYAEAHYPKVTEYVDPKTGKPVPRYPHIHLVIPKINLLTGKDLHPFGYEKQNLKFMDAWQEYINHKFGLVSPKDRPRFGREGKADVLQRVKQDADTAEYFKGTGSKLKNDILQAVIDRKIESFEAFEAMLSEFGTVDTGVSRDHGPYLKVKAPGERKFARLSQFTREFIEKPTAQKIAAVNAKLTGQAADGAPRPIPQHVQKLLNEWYELRSHELALINSGSRKLYLEYSNSPRAEKLAIISKLRAKSDQQLEVTNHDGTGSSLADHLRAASQDLRTAEHHIRAIGQHSGNLDTAARNILDRSNSRVIAAAIQRCVANQEQAPTERVEPEPHHRQSIAGQRIIDNPQIVLDGLTRSQSVFKWSDIERYVMRNTDGPEQFKAAFDAVLNSPQLVRQLADEKERFTTREILDIETRLIERADKLAAAKGYALSDKVRDATAAARTFNEGQAGAFDLLTGPKRIAVVNGAAGTGKSYVLAAMREAYEAEGFKLYGAILQGKTAEDLERDSGIKSSTMHSFLSALDKGQVQLNAKSVVVVDEAGMIGSRQMEKLLAHVQRSGASIRLVGDSAQLAAVDFGDAFKQLSARVDRASLTQIKRQHIEWQQKASEQLSNHEIAKGLAAYDKHGNLHQSDTTADAKRAIVAQWQADREQDPSKTQIVLAHTNAERSELNKLMHGELLKRGELGEEKVFRTENGLLRLAERDKIMFLENEYESLKVRNGTAATVEKINGNMIDARLPDGRMVRFDINKYSSIDHGYALTAFKTQGMTVDRAYMLASPGMTAETTYVGMTRHREALRVHYSKEQFANRDELAKRLARKQEKEFSATKAPSAAKAATLQRDADSLVSNLLREAKDNQKKLLAEASGEWADIRQNIDATRLIAFVSKTNGIDPEDFDVTKGEDGGDRIQYGTRSYNASDFLTKVVHLSWDEAKPILRDCYAEQQAELPIEARQPVKMDLWRDFQAWKVKGWPAERSGAWEVQKQSERARLADIKGDAERDRRRAEQNIDPRNHQERRAALSVVSMRRIEQERVAREQTAAERQDLKATLNLKSPELYRLWLARQAEQGSDQALAELRRQQRRTTPAVAHNANALKAASEKAAVQDSVSLKDKGITYKVSDRGEVTYLRNGREFLRDEARAVVCLEHTADNIDTALRLAVQKFGSTLNVNGGEDFQRRAVEVAVERGLRIDFKNEVLQSYKLHLEEQAKAKFKVHQPPTQAKEKATVSTTPKHHAGAATPAPAAAVQAAPAPKPQAPANDVLSSVASKHQSWMQERVAQMELQRQREAEERQRRELEEQQRRNKPKGPDHEPSL